MNGIDRIVSRHRRGAWQVLPELASGKAGAGMALAAGLALAHPAWAQSVVTTGYTATYDGSTTTVLAPGNQGSSISSPVYVYVAGTSAGTASITNGGSIYAYKGVAIGGGTTSSATGTVTVDGVGSSLTADAASGVGELAVGANSSSGVLTVTNGGTVSSGWGTIGYGSTTATSSVTVDGSGSVWTNIGDIFLGSISSGLVTIKNGGRLTTRDLYLGDTGAGPVGNLDLDGTASARGVLETGWILERNTSSTFTFDGGILRATGAQSNFLQGFSAGGITIDSGGAYIDTQGYSVGIATAGIFTGTGGLTKQGTGTLTLAGGNTWSGNTTVSAGTLTLDNYTQTSGQTLGIGATSNSDYGKLNVNGTATFNAGANLAVNVASANTLANGQVLSGVVSAGTLNATTFNVTDNSALFNFTSAINGNNVDLDVAASGSGSGSSSTGTTIYRSVLDNRLFPALGAAVVLDTQIQGSPGGDMANVVTAFGQLPDERSVARAAVQTLPQTSGPAAMLGTLSAVNRLFASRFAPGATGVATGDAPADKQVWIKPFGSHASQSDQNNASGFSSNTWGLAAGYDGAVGKTRLGLAYAYARTSVSGNTDLSGTASSATIDTNVLALYGSRPLNAANDLALGFQADTGWNDSRSSRGLSFGNLNRTANGSYGTWSAHAGLNLSKAIALNADNLLVPALRVDYTRLNSQAYGESGAGALDLNVNAKTTQALVFGVDARLVHAIDERSQIEASLGVGYDAINDAGDIVAAYAGAPGQSFLASGVQHSPLLFQGGLGYTYKTGKGASISLRYDVEGRTGYLNQSAMLKASWRF